MFSENTAGYHKAIRREALTVDRGTKIGYLTPIEKNRVSKFKIPKSTDDKSTWIRSLDQWKANVKTGMRIGAETRKPQMK
jgi:hypothetical protein